MELAMDFDFSHASRWPCSVTDAAMEQRPRRPRPVTVLGSSAQRHEQRLRESSQRLVRRLEERRCRESSADFFDSRVQRRPRSAATTPLHASTRALLEDLHQRLDALAVTFDEHYDELAHGVEDISFRCGGLDHDVKYHCGGLVLLDTMPVFEGEPIYDAYDDFDSSVPVFDCEPVYDQYVYDDDDIVLGVEQLDDAFGGNHHVLLPAVYDDDLFVGLVKKAVEDEDGRDQAEAVMEEQDAASPPFVRPHASSTSIVTKDVVIAGAHASAAAATATDEVPSDTTYSTSARCSMKWRNPVNSITAPIPVHMDNKEVALDTNLVAAMTRTISFVSSHISTKVLSTCSTDGQNHANFVIVYSEGPLSGEEHLQLCLPAPAAATWAPRGITNEDMCIFISGKANSISVNTSGITTIEPLLASCICVDCQPWPPPILLEMHFDRALIRPMPWPNFIMSVAFDGGYMSSMLLSKRFSSQCLKICLKLLGLFMIGNGRWLWDPGIHSSHQGWLVVSVIAIALLDVPVKCMDIIVGVILEKIVLDIGNRTIHNYTHTWKLFQTDKQRIANVLCCNGWFHVSSTWILLVLLFWSSLIPEQKQGDELWSVIWNANFVWKPTWQLLNLYHRPSCIWVLCQEVKLQLVVGTIIFASRRTAPTLCSTGGTFSTQTSIIFSTTHSVWPHFDSSLLEQFSVLILSVLAISKWVDELQYACVHERIQWQQHSWSWPLLLGSTTDGVILRSLPWPSFHHAQVEMQYKIFC